MRHFYYPSIFGGQQPIKSLPFLTLCMEFKQTSANFAYLDSLTFLRAKTKQGMDMRLRVVRQADVRQAVVRQTVVRQVVVRHFYYPSHFDAEQTMRGVRRPECVRFC